MYLPFNAKWNEFKKQLKPFSKKSKLDMEINTHLKMFGNFFKPAIRKLGTIEKRKKDHSKHNFLKE